MADIQEAHILNENEAQELTAKIYGHLDKAMVLIKQAYYGRADIALGYPSWDDYIKGEFEGCALRLPREKRKEAVKSLTEAGMPQRAIASAIGVDQATVQRDLKSVDANASGETKVTGLDGKTYTKQIKPLEPTSISGTFNDAPADLPKGKPAVKATKDTRHPLVRKADDAAWELRKAIEKMADVLADEHYPEHKNQVQLSISGAIQFAQTVLSEQEN